MNRRACAYLTSFHTELRRFDDMVIKIRDIVDNRLTRNLEMISNLVLCDIPHEGETYTLDKFVSQQEKHVKEQTSLMAAKNVEVEEAVERLLQPAVVSLGVGPRQRRRQRAQDVGAPRHRAVQQERPSARKVRQVGKFS